MPVTVEHEAPLEVLERFPDLLPRLLREQFGLYLPQSVRVRPARSNHNVTVVQELRSDSAFVLDLEPDKPPTCAVILEPQRSIKPEKWFAWPSYLADLHRTHRCDSYLIVFALGENASEVAAWARQPIRSFQPGKDFAPYVIGPPETPAPKTIEAAKADLAGTALGTIMHLQDPDGAEVALLALRALYEERGVDMMVWMYYLIRGIVGDERFTEIERLIMLDIQKNYLPRTAFEREHYSRGKSEGKAEGKVEGRAEGRAEGKAEAVLAVLAARSLVATEEQRLKLLACADAAKLDRLIARAVSATSIAELLADL